MTLNSNDIQVRIAANIVKNQPKPIPINADEAMIMAHALMQEFWIQEMTENPYRVI